VRERENREGERVIKYRMWSNKTFVEVNFYDVVSVGASSSSCASYFSFECFSNILLLAGWLADWAGGKQKEQKQVVSSFHCFNISKQLPFERGMPFPSLSCSGNCKDVKGAIIHVKKRKTFHKTDDDDVDQYFVSMHAQKNAFLREKRSSNGSFDNKRCC